MATPNWPAITADTPLEVVQAIHKKIWDYAIEHDHKPATPYISCCVLCEYASRITCQSELGRSGSKGNWYCKNCPAIWPKTMEFVSADPTRPPCMESYFGEWSSLRSTQYQINTAAKAIRDIQFKSTVFSSGK